MSAESNDTAPLHSACIRKISIVVKDYNQIKLASNVIVLSDMIVTGMMQTDEALTISLLAVMLRCNILSDLSFHLHSIIFTASKASP